MYAIRQNKEKQCRTIGGSSQNTHHNSGIFKCLQRCGSSTSDIPVDNSPIRIGKEIELPFVTLSRKDKTKLTNGMKIAQTQEAELDIPLISLEVEGVERGNPCIELILAPLPVKSKDSKFEKSIKALLEKFKRFRQETPINTYIDEYNTNKGVYELNMSTADELYASCSGHGSFYIQSNISTPFDYIGKGDILDKFFKGSKVDTFKSLRLLRH